MKFDESTHIETRNFARNEELNMAGDSVLSDTRLEPRLSEFVAGNIDRHPGLKVVHTTQNQVDSASRFSSCSEGIYASLNHTDCTAVLPRRAPSAQFLVSEWNEDTKDPRGFKLIQK